LVEVGQRAASKVGRGQVVGHGALRPLGYQLLTERAGFGRNGKPDFWIHANRR